LEENDKVALSNPFESEEKPEETGAKTEK
jgi:hypothetical protein